MNKPIDPELEALLQEEEELQARLTVPTFDPRDLAPKGRRSIADRREGPLRKAEIILDFAADHLIEAACELVDAKTSTPEKDRSWHIFTSRVKDYRQAEAKLFQSQAEQQGRTLNDVQ